VSHLRRLKIDTSSSPNRSNFQLRIRRLKMRRFRALQQSGKGLFGTLIIGPMLYAVFALLVSTPARSQAGCQLVTCSFDQTTCYEESGGVGTCCLVCYTYSCPDGTFYNRCRTECGAQC
jgi:hypothetical protein